MTTVPPPPPQLTISDIHTRLVTMVRTIDWERPMQETLARMGFARDLSMAAWAQIPWYGPLEVWRADPEVSDLLFNGPEGDPIFIIKNGEKMTTPVYPHRSWITWTQRQLLLRSAKLAPTGAGTWPDPLVQGVVDRKLRYAIAQEPASRRGPSISIRVLPERWRTLPELIDGGVITREAAELILFALESHATVLVSGATGSGKTTLTAGFTQALGSKGHRMVFIEDGGELPPTADSLHLEADSDRIGEFTRFIKFTLRVKPTYTVVGEVRGGEAMAMLQAAATGHPGIGTIHASNVQGALRNLERMAMLGLAAEAGGGGQAAAAIVRGLITSDSVNLIVVHVGVTPRGRRSVLAIEEVSRMGAQGQGGDTFPTNPLFHYDPQQDRLLRVGNVNGMWGLGRI